MAVKSSTSPPLSCGLLFNFEFVADSQHTTIVIPFNITAAFVQLSNSSGAAKVEGNTVFELIRETNGKCEVEFVAIVLNVFIGTNDEARLQTNLECETFGNIEVGQNGDVDEYRLRLFHF